MKEQLFDLTAYKAYDEEEERRAKMDSLGEDLLQKIGSLISEDDKTSIGDLNANRFNPLMHLESADKGSIDQILGSRIFLDMYMIADARVQMYESYRRFREDNDGQRLADEMRRYSKQIARHARDLERMREL